MRRVLAGSVVLLGLWLAAGLGTAAAQSAPGPSLEGRAPLAEVDLDAQTMYVLHNLGETIELAPDTEVTDEAGNTVDVSSLARHVTSPPKVVVRWKGEKTAGGVRATRVWIEGPLED